MTDLEEATFWLSNFGSGIRVLLKASSCLREGRRLLVVQRLAEEVFLVAVTAGRRVSKRRPVLAASSPELTKPTLPRS
jgi:hypothetical protein